MAQIIQTVGASDTASQQPTFQPPALHLPALDAEIERRVRTLTKRDVVKKVRHLRHFLNLSFFGLRPHRSPSIGSDWIDRPLFDLIAFASSFTARELRGGLGNSKGDYERYLKLFWDFAPYGLGYDRVRAVTKAYLLTDETAAMLTDCWCSETGTLVGGVAGQPFQRVDLPSNGIVRTSFSTLHVPSVVPFDASRVDEIINRLEQNGGLQGEKLLPFLRKRHVIALRWLYAARQWIRALGGVPNYYEDFKSGSEPDRGNGRLYGIGEFHLQRLNREPRRLLYEGSGWWDYDFVACHPTIIQCLARSYQIETPFLDDYLARRSNAFHEELAEAWGTRPGKVKRVMTSIFYGQRRSLHKKYSSLRRMVGEPSGKLILSDLYFLAIREEARAVRNRALEVHTHGSQIVNAVGKLALSRNPKGKAVSPNRLFSHIVTGYEAWAVNVALNSMNTLLVVMHDGWISTERHDERSIERHIREKSVQELGVQLYLILKGTCM